MTQIKEKLQNIETKYLFTGLTIIILIGLIAGSTYLTTQETIQDQDKIQVVATFYPFYDITQNIAGEKAEVNTLVPTGMDPHSFEPTAQDIQALESADIFVATGAEFEAWEKELIETAANNNVTIVDPSEHIELLRADETPDLHHEEHHEENHHEEENHEDEHGENHSEHETHEEDHSAGHEEGHQEHDHGIYDPHYWLSPKNAIVISEEIGSALKNVDDENSDYYQEQQHNYVSELESLDTAYSERLSECRHDKILITHAAFTYLGQDYGFTQVPIQGLGHLTEPTAQELQRLSDEAEEHGLEYIFYDSVVDPSVSETIASEVGAETLVLHSIEAVENPSEDTYLLLMEQNLENLEVALGCQTTS